MTCLWGCKAGKGAGRGKGSCSQECLKSSNWTKKVVLDGWKLNNMNRFMIWKGLGPFYDKMGPRGDNMRSCLRKWNLGSNLV